MRECLGWITNCGNDASCPQNWLELAVSELPTKVRCHVCEQPVDLVLSQDALQGAAQLAAFPVVPCTGMTGAASSPPGNGAAAAPVVPYDPPPAAAPAAKKRWSVRLGNGEVIPIDKPTLIIGRSRTCDVIIQSAKVSRQHASITEGGGTLHIEDLGSANGVWINGEKVTRTKISNGDTFSISDETLTFELK